MKERHAHAARSDDDWDKLRQELTTKIEELETQNHSMLEKLRSIEGENLHFAERYVEVEEENNNLAKPLYGELSASFDAGLE